MTEIDIERHHELVQQRQKEHCKFSATFKKEIPKNPDKVIQEIRTEVSSEINCAKYASCCKSLGPLFTEADVTCTSRVLHMKPSVPEETYLRVDEDGDKVLQSMSRPLLGNGNLCTIYDARPKTYHEFPHIDRRKIY